MQVQVKNISNGVSATDVRERLKNLPQACKQLPKACKNGDNFDEDQPLRGLLPSIVTLPARNTVTGSGSGPQYEPDGVTQIQ